MSTGGGILNINAKWEMGALTPEKQDNAVIEIKNEKKKDVGSKHKRHHALLYSMRL